MSDYLVEREFRQSKLAPEDVPPRDRPRTVAHLASTTLHAIGHVSRHIGEAQGTSDMDSIKFNLQHAATHTDEAHEHAQKLIGALAMYHPGVADELDRLHQVTRPAAVPPPGTAEKASYDYNATGSSRDPCPA